MVSFYSEEELKALGLKAYGANVKISKKASIYGADSITLGNDVRIDDFCILSGKINIGNNVHIAVYTCLFASEYGIQLEDYCNISSRVAIYAISDDYSGESMTNPTIPEKFKNIQGERVVLRKHTIIGTGTTILPGVIIGEGVSVGCMSLVTKSLDPWCIYVGVPCRRLKERSKKLLELEKQYIIEKIEVNYNMKKQNFEGGGAL